MSSSVTSRVTKGTLKSALRFGRAPVIVSWIVTNRCNLRCVYCACPDIKTRELNTEQAMDVIDDMADLGTAVVHITGGEPLVRKDVAILIQRMRFHAMRVSVSTNGTLVPRRIKLLKDVSQVSMSLDGPPPVHDLNRAEGQVDEVIAALETLQEHGVERKLQALVTSRTTYECLDFVLEQGEKYGAPVYFQPALAYVLTTDNPNPVVAQAAHVNMSFSDLERRKAEGQAVGNTVESLRHMGTWPNTEPLHCPINRAVVRITPEGFLLPCHERADAPDGQSLLEHGFKEAFKRLRLKQCNECWGCGRVEMRQAVTGGKGFAAMVNRLRGG